MKSSYPSYRCHGLERVFKNLSESERSLITEFISYCAIGAGTRKQEDIKRSITQFRDIVEKHLDEINLQDLRGFLAVLNGSRTNSRTSV